mgnify:CR=1 FL=1
MDETGKNTLLWGAIFIFVIVIMIIIIAVAVKGNNPPQNCCDYSKSPGHYSSGSHPSDKSYDTRTDKDVHTSDEKPPQKAPSEYYTDRSSCEPKYVHNETMSSGDGYKSYGNESNDYKKVIRVRGPDYGFTAANDYDCDSDEDAN